MCRDRPAARPDLLRQTHTTIDFHGARVGTFHFREERRPILLFDQGTCDAALTEINGEGQADGTGADNQNLGIPQMTPCIRHGD
jgi:hypothetical protein